MGGGVSLRFFGQFNWREGPWSCEKVINFVDAHGVGVLWEGGTSCTRKRFLKNFIVKIQ
jgi:hypothetical protein